MIEDSIENDSQSSTSTDPKLSSSTPINFEDLIAVSNVTPQLLEDELTTTTSTTMAAAKTATTTTTTIPVTKTIQKITPVTTKTGGTSQVVIIQGRTGTTVPIKIPTNVAQNTDQNKPVTIQVRKMPDGNIVQIKNNKTLNLTNLSNITQMNVGTKKSVSDQNQSITIKTTNASSSVAAINQPKTIIANSNIFQTTQILKPISPSEVRKLTAPKFKIVESATVPISTNSSSNMYSAASSATAASTTSITKPLVQKIVMPDNKETIKKTEMENNTKLLVPHRVLKLSPNSSVPIQTIQIQGKSVQYVRFRNTTSTTATTSTLSNCTVLPGKIITNTGKDTATNTNATQINTNQKIILNTRARQNSPIAINKDTLTRVSSVTKTPQTKSLITTYPTLRKISGNGKSFIILDKNKTEDKKLVQKETVVLNSFLNNQSESSASQSGKKTSNNDQPPNKIPCVVMISKDMVKKAQNEDSSPESNSVTIVKKSDSPSPRKLFSVLKPSSDVIENNIASSRKRSLSPPEEPRRKHCNCTKSQCLKLYCDCFANGEFCFNCNCKECFNNLAYEEERQNAIKMCLERNPSAFKPKITKARDQSDQRLHNKGCNCKKSGCLKNYCECYEAKIACSSNCKCQGCRNTEDRDDIDSIGAAKINFSRSMSKRNFEDITASTSTDAAGKLAYSFITEEVVNATVQCMLAQTDECKKNQVSSKSSEKMVLEELGRCLVEIIDFSIRNMEN